MQLKSLCAIVNPLLVGLLMGWTCTADAVDGDSANSNPYSFNFSQLSDIQLSSGQLGGEQQNVGQQGNMQLVSATKSSVCDSSSWESFQSKISEANPRSCQSARHPLEQLSFFVGVDGAKQPQDFGVNADLGVRLRGQYSAPLAEDYGLGYQVGTATTWTDNAVRVFELLGEDTTRFQSYTTLGLFQRVGDWGWGTAFDYLYQDGFDKTSLGQFRSRITYNATENTQLGASLRLRAFDDTAQFLGDEVTLRSINQGSLFFRHFYETGVQFTLWAGLVEEHGESNAALGPAPARENSLVVGSDFLAPLNNSLALYGETNLITPADTGTVDAYFGMVWYPFANAKTAYRQRFAPMFNVAAPTSVSVDLLP